MKKSQIERAIEALEAKKTDVYVKAKGEMAAFDCAIEQLRAQQSKRAARKSHPMAVPA